VPELPAPSYRRLSRYDEAGLLWLLKSRPVVAMTEATATIATPGGGTLHLLPARPTAVITAKE
jgi:hypothetical protein